MVLRRHHWFPHGTLEAPLPPVRGFSILWLRLRRFWQERQVRRPAAHPRAEKSVRGCYWLQWRAFLGNIKREPVEPAVGVAVTIEDQLPG